jgi:DNA helicase-2/ATP-dependent DNA helicase PcrA
MHHTINGVKTISVLETGSAKAEAVAVGKTIEELIGGMGFHYMDFCSVSGQKHTPNKTFSDFAVLYRTAVQNRIFSEVFDSAGIPYQIVSKANVFNIKGIKELISLLKIIEELGCFADLERIVSLTNRSVTRQVFETFKNWSYDHRFSLSGGLDNARRFPVKELGKPRQMRFNKFLDELLEMKKKIKDLEVEKKILFLVKNTRLAETINRDPKTKQVLKQLIDISKTFGFNAPNFFSTIALQSDTDTYEPQAEKVSLMTMHTAKGLEFPIVFLVGCENGYLPFQRSDVETTDVDEERRLFYVSMTRAQDRLYLTFAKKRKIYGKTKMRTISPFIEEIEDRLKMQEKSILGKKKKNGPTQLKLF